MSNTEFDLIQQYFSPAIHRNDVVLAGGDDCAIVNVAHGDQLAVTTDTLVAGVHFPYQTSPEDIASKAIAVNLSDLAAMGATPAWVSLSLTLPEVDHAWLQAFSARFNDVLSAENIALIGGDTTSGPLSISLQAMGFLTAGKAMRRSHARVGDRVYVSGTLGDAAIGLHCVQNNIDDDALRECVERLNRPRSRHRFAGALVKHCDCAIDISDGLLADLGHILTASHCGARLDVSKTPLSSAARYYFKHYNDNVIDWSMVLSHGDDYELCFTLAPEHAEKTERLAAAMQLPLACIGEITRDRKLVCLDENRQPLAFPSAGYLHFK